MIDLDDYDRIVVGYHANCMDGWGAFWAISTLFDHTKVVGFPLFPDEPLPQEMKDITFQDRTLAIFADITPSPVELGRGFADQVVVLDHHISSRDKMKRLSHDYGFTCIYNVRKSGAVLAWEFANLVSAQKQSVPDLLKYIQDRDLWTWKLVDSKEVSAFLETVPKSLDSFTDLSNNFVKRFSTIVNCGKSLLKMKDKMVDLYLDKVKFIEVKIQSEYLVVPVVFCSDPYVKSQLGAAMLTLNTVQDVYPFSIVLGAPDRASFRSCNDGLDVSKICKKLGGGGHRNAAGLTNAEFLTPIFKEYFGIGEKV